MKNWIVFVSTCVLLVLVGVHGVAFEGVWPQPVSAMAPNVTRAWIFRSANFHIELITKQTDSFKWDEVKNLLTEATARYSNAMLRSAAARPRAEATNVCGITSVVSVDIRQPTTQLTLDTDERYRLLVDSKGVLVTAESVFGALRALETIAQLLEPIKPDDDNSLLLSWVDIIDFPRFPYRGLMIDTARHFQPLEVILKQLDAMEANKLNVLHWHVTDHESFPFQSKLHPKLVDGAWSPHEIYTYEDVQYVSHQAFLRGIRVVPEFDTPGHTSSWGKGYPEILSRCPEVLPPLLYMLNPTLPKTRTVVRDILIEAATVFGKSDLIHLGGDEVDTRCWEHDDNIINWMKANNVSDVTDILKSFHKFSEDVVYDELHRTPIVWEEVSDSNLPMHPDTIVGVWMGGTSNIMKATKNGHRVILSNCWYLDHLGDDWVRMYRCEPTNFFGTTTQKKLIIGGHSSMWGESVDQSNIFPRVWPRASSVAERLWSSKEFVDKQASNTERYGHLALRMALQRCRLVARGIQASPIEPGMCEFETEIE